MKIELDASRAQAAFKAAPQTMTTILGQYLDRAAGIVAAAEKKEAPKGATSLLTNSVHVITVSPLVRDIQPGADYAAYVHGGRQPGKFPNMAEGSPFWEWVKSVIVGRKAARRKGGKSAVRDAAFMIGRSIRNKGIEADPFAQRAFDRSKSRVEALMREGTEAGIKAVFG